MKLSEMRKGSVVLVRGGFGNEAPRHATVLETIRDVKHGYPGIDYCEHETREERWAYLDQVVRVVKY